MISLRPYQAEAIDALFKYWAEGGGNPLVSMATGTGKSLVIAKLVQDLVQNYPSIRILMLVHVRELVEQNAKALQKLWPDAPLGVYSAGLNRREAHRQITYASIQSVHRRAKSLGPRHLVLIDEAHLVPQAGDGMYLWLLEDLRESVPNLRVAGFTATPYRLGFGRLDTGENRVFDKTVYEYGIGQGIDDGYLSPLISRAGIQEINVKGVGKRGGEFVAGKAMQSAATQVVDSAVREIVEFGADRRSWLVFADGVDTAEAVRDKLRAHPYRVRCEMVTGQTPSAERRQILEAFKRGEIQCLTNAMVLTTGFDAPNVDLIAMLRPTLSTGLYVQIVGRGTRLAESKENCLILDYAGNVRRHGPVDDILVSDPKKRRPGAPDDDEDEEKVSVNSKRAKDCEKCKALIPIYASVCNHCGHISKVKHEAEAEKNVGITSKEKVPRQQVPVISWEFNEHNKPGKPPSLRVTYIAGMSRIREWVCLEHEGFARQKAHRWWRDHSGISPPPETIAEALRRHGELTMPATVAVEPDGEYIRIVSRSFAKEKELVDECLL